jgi:pimeloyl-ACP methyl ester carboxylesterase
MNTELPMITNLREPSELRDGAKVMLFVHGIFSSPKTFTPLLEDHFQDSEWDDWFCYGFHYDFHQPIPESGSQLAEKLTSQFGSFSEVEVTLICHSMGGLVGRLALLQKGDELPFVKRLVMLGTPNHGTLHSARLGMLAHLSRESLGLLWPVFTRKEGIKQLTEVDTMLDEFLEDPDCQRRTEHVEYVTIPGMFFNKDTRLAGIGQPGGNAGLSALDVGMNLLKLFPLWKVGLERPHDGIVEASSVDLGARQGGVFSERSVDCNENGKAAKYVHAEHKQHLHSTHIQVHTAKATADLIKLLLLSPDLASWRQGIRDQGQRCHLFPGGA